MIPLLILIIATLASIVLVEGYGVGTETRERRER